MISLLPGARPTSINDFVLRTTAQGWEWSDPVTNRRENNLILRVIRFRDSWTTQCQCIGMERSFSPLPPIPFTESGGVAACDPILLVTVDSSKRLSLITHGYLLSCSYYKTRAYMGPPALNKAGGELGKSPSLPEDCISCKIPAARVRSSDILTAGVIRKRSESSMLQAFWNNSEKRSNVCHHVTCMCNPPRKNHFEG